ncbi:MAG: hypothetical protein ABI413_11290 [Ktedonobacteraceae bacterium]
MEENITTAPTTRESILQAALGESINLEAWQRYMKDGFIVEIKVKHWRARKKLTLYELGIKPQDAETAEVYEQLISLGTNVLLPPQTLKDLESIERQARLHLKNCSFETPFGRFIPWSAYNDWKSGNEAYKQRFFDMRDLVVSEYANLIDELLTQYEVIAKNAYFLLEKQYERGDYRSFEEMFPDEKGFIEHFKLNLIARYIKTAEQFGETFVYTERFSRIDLGALALDKEKIAEPDAWLSEREMKRAAATKRQEMLMQMERDLVDQARSQKKNMIDQFLESLMIQTRTITYDAVTSVLASIQKEETLQGRPAIQLKELVKKIQQLNFYEDADIDRMLTSLHAIIEKPAKERDLAEIQRQLRAIATLSRATVLALGDEAPRTEKEINPTDIGIPDFPSDDEIREAREEILLAQPIQTNEAEEIREEREERNEAEPEQRDVKYLNQWAEELQRTEREN